MSDAAHSTPRASRAGRDRLAFWAPVTISVVLGVFAGLGAYTFSYAKGLSYFSTDPKACVNCHIMEPQYAGWQMSSHHTAAVCVDCHLPQSFIPKYLAKAENGWRHGERFTTQNFHEPIYVQEGGLEILQDNCVRCHEPIVDAIVGYDGRKGMTDHPAYPGLEQSDAMQCIHCHWTVGHGQRAGLGGPMTAADTPQPAATPRAPHAQ